MNSTSRIRSEGDHVKYAPFHRVADPKTTKSQSTGGEVTEVNERPKKEDLEHKTYTIQNDKTGKESTYGIRAFDFQRHITEKLDD
ncbi:hypothetical protein ACEPAI_8463 [Sanghuangporus weigelae]